MTLPPRSGVALGIDTAGVQPGVALIGSGELICSRYQDPGRARGEITAGFIASVFEEAHIAARDLSVIGVVRGPGSFTGLRIALGLARGLCISGQQDVVGVSAFELTLEASGLRSGRVCALLHAGRKKVYAATYRIEGDRYVGLTEPVAAAPAAVLAALAQDGPSWILVGDAASTVAAEVAADLRSNFEVIETGAKRAVTLAKVAQRAFAEGQGMPAYRVMPLYVGGTQAVPPRDPGVTRVE